VSNKRAPIFLVTAIKGDRQTSAMMKLKSLLDEGWYVFRGGTPGRKHLQAGDGICFYEAGVGVIAEAVAASAAEHHHELPFNPDPERYPWAFQVRKVRYFREPIRVTPELRERLEGYKGKNVDYQWGWYFQGTHVISEHDFKILVGRG